MHGVNESRVKLWIDALRSGEFTQANGYLEATVLTPEDKRVTGNCCLGVAQHVALRNGWVPKDRAVADLDWGPTAMSLEAARWFGFDNDQEHTSPDDPFLGEHEVPSAEGGTYTTTVFCVEANDDLGWDFNRIANALEARYITPATSKESNSDG